MRSARWLAAVLSLALLPSCSRSPTEGDVLQDVVIGRIDLGGTLDRVLIAPSSTRAGELFMVTVSTFGGGCTSAAGAEVVVREMVATITPYDQELRGVPCTEELRTFSRQVSVRFERAGEATIVVRGRSFPDRGIVTVEHRLAVTAD